jgi:hypothetical protein
VHAQGRKENGKKHAGRSNWRGRKLVEEKRRLTRAGAADPKRSVGMGKVA